LIDRLRVNPEGCIGGMLVDIVIVNDYETVEPGHLPLDGKKSPSFSKFEVDWLSWWVERSICKFEIGIREGVYYLAFDD